MVSPILSENLAGLAGIAHGYFTREGGVSEGVYSSLNAGLGSKDKQDDVNQNRTRIAAHLGVSPDKMFIPYQVHSARAVVAGIDFQGAAPGSRCGRRKPIRHGCRNFNGRLWAGFVCGCRERRYWRRTCRMAWGVDWNIGGGFG